MKTARGRYFLLSLVLVTSVASAEDWVVRKNAGNMNCFVQPATGLAAPASQLLTRAATRKAACEAAAKLFVENDEPGKCPAYTPNSQAECKQDGILLR